MCGIIGIISKNEVVYELYNGLLALQHRGQDSAGIACQERIRLNIKKGVGLVGDIFTNDNLKLLKGNYGIAHVRYSTIGASLKQDAQPFFVGYPNLIAIAHNGNIVNYDCVANNFRKELESNCDVEIILHSLAEKIGANKPTKENIFNALEEIMKEMNGSYSCVCTIAGLGLLAFRDPHGIRPLIFGKNQNGFTFASETVALDAINYDYIRDIKPGEAVLITEDLQVHEKIILAKEPRHCMFEWIYFARPDSEIEGKSVYVARIKLGKALAKQIKYKGINADVIVPVPDTSKPSALGLSRELGVTTEEGLIKNRYIGRTFIMPTQKQREKAMFVKLNPSKVVLEDKNVILIDDSIVRGTTSRRIVNITKKYAKNVCFVSTCPPLKYPCYYGVDFPLPEELIANTKSVDEIKKEIGADELIYATIDDIKEAIRIPGLCLACLDKDYPTEITKELEKSIQNARNKERERIKSL